MIGLGLGLGLGLGFKGAARTSKTVAYCTCSSGAPGRVRGWGGLGGRVIEAGLGLGLRLGLGSGWVGGRTGQVKPTLQPRPTFTHPNPSPSPNPSPTPSPTPSPIPKAAHRAGEAYVVAAPHVQRIDDHELARVTIGGGWRPI